MSKSIEQIKQDLTVLENIVGAIAIELQDIYKKYLDSLSESVQKQLILVSYQICTREYPKSFLNLSLDRRQTLQQDLRQLAKELGDRIVSILTTDDSFEIEQNNNPQAWIDWHQDIRITINEDLEEISKQANQLLEKAKIITPQLPEKVMEMAIAAEDTEVPIGGYPNMLNMLVEAGEEEEDRGTNITKITAIRLRLSEIEFADPALSTIGNQMRNILAKIEKIRQQYHTKERELLLAEAEAAWRSSWYED